MIKLEKRKFVDFYSKGKAGFANREFLKCQFVNCFIGEKGVLNRATIQNVRLVNCSQDRCLLVAPLLKDVLVDGLNTKGQIPEILGAVFERVTLRGKIDRLCIKPWLVDSSTQEEFDKANSEFYKKVELALDISELDCQEIDLSGVPVELIRRDPETQAIVSREKIAEGKWKGLPFQRGLFEVQLEDAAEFGFPGVVLIAPKRDPKMKKLLADLEMLRNEGIAEPD